MYKLLVSLGKGYKILTLWYLYFVECVQLITHLIGLAQKMGL